MEPNYYMHILQHQRLKLRLYYVKHMEERMLQWEANI